jgi:hypothetical protein
MTIHKYKESKPQRRTMSSDYTLEEVDKNKAIGRLSNPNPNYTKSDEGVAEFKKAGLEYPDNDSDTAYQILLERTPTGPGNPFAKKNKTRITAIYRYRLAPGREFLVWNEVETRYTPLGNPEQDHRLNLGRYPVIEYQNIMKQEESGYRYTVTEPTGYTKTGYSMPYTLEDIDILHKNASDDYGFEELNEREIKPTRYYLKDLRKRTTVSVKKWEDFRDGDFDELYEYGTKITSPEQAQQIKDKVELQRKRVEEQKLDMLKRSV